MLSNHKSEDLLPTEIKALQNAKEHLRQIKEIDMCKRHPANNKTVIENAMDRQDFDLLTFYLECKHADKVLTNLIADEAYQKIYIRYLLSEKHTRSFANALAILKKCPNADNVILLLQNNSLTAEKMPLIHYAISQKHPLILKIILESKTVHDLLKCTMKDTDGLFKTPLEYARNNKEAHDPILYMLSKDNPYAEAVMKNDRQALEKLLKEAKLQEDNIQEQLQIAGVCSLISGQSWDIDYLLFKAGMRAYPTSPYYRTSYLYEILSAPFQNKPLQIELIKYCLSEINKLKEPEKTNALQESINGQNLRELADAKKQGNDIIQLLTEAGATLSPIQFIKENKLDHFKLRINDITLAHLNETAKYCIEQYDEKNGDTEKNKNLKTFLKALLKKRGNELAQKGSEKTLADFALESGKISLIPLVKHYGIRFSDSKPSSPEKNYQNPVDILAEDILHGDLESLKIFLNKQSEYKQKDLLNSPSSQGLTLAELAVIHDKRAILAFLVGHPKYNLKKNGVFDIIDPTIIHELLDQFQEGFIKFRGILKNALKNYPSDYKDPIIDPKKESPTLSSIHLKRIITSIITGQLASDTDTFTCLAKIKRHDSKKGFKDKVAAYLQRLENQNPKEIDQLFQLEKMNALENFFSVKRGKYKPSITRGTLAILSDLWNRHLERQSSFESEEPEELEESKESLMPPAINPELVNNEIIPSAPPAYLLQSVTPISYPETQTAASNLSNIAPSLKTPLPLLSIQKAAPMTPLEGPLVQSPELVSESATSSSSSAMVMSSLASASSNSQPNVPRSQPQLIPQAKQSSNELSHSSSPRSLDASQLAIPRDFISRNSSRASTLSPLSSSSDSNFSSVDSFFPSSQSVIIPRKKEKLPCGRKLVVSL